MAGIGRFSAAVQAVMEVAQEQLGNWEPEDGEEFDAMLAALGMEGGLWDTFRGIFQRMATTLHEHASEHPVVAEMEEAATSFDGLQEAFHQVYERHRVEHEVQMKRYEDPKPGETTWNV